MSDESGHWPKFITKAVNAVKKAVKAVGSVLAIGKAALDISPTTAKIAVASGLAVGRVKQPLRIFTKVFKSKVFSSYKGTPVLKQSILNGSMSISNTIFLDKGEDRISVLKHEWGHTVHESLMGSTKYITKIAIPSVTGNKLHFEPYYSQPWERSADFFGGANNGPYLDGSEVMAGVYFIMP